MTGIRQQKKEKVRMDILQTAKKLFIEKGYDEVSMEEIAKEAFVGTGTLYNYYKNKGDIFMASIQQATDEDPEYNLVGHHPVKTLEIILDYFDSLLLKYEWMFSRSIMKGFIKAAVSIGASKDSWFKNLASMDLKYIKRLEDLLIRLRDLGVFEGDPRQYAELIYSGVAYELILYIYFDELTMEQVKMNAKEKIRIILR